MGGLPFTDIPFLLVVSFVVVGIQLSSLALWYLFLEMMSGCLIFFAVVFIKI